MWIDLVLLALVIVAGVYLFRMRSGSTGWSYYPALARQAGNDPDQLRPFYWTAKIVLALMLPLVLGNILGRFPSLLIVIPLAILGFMIPDITLAIRRSTRRFRILQALSFYLDMVVSFLRSGLSLEESVNRAAVRGLPPDHPLAEEVKLVGEEISAGKDRAVAFSALARRTNLPDLHAVAAALELGSRLGFPVADILSTQADLQRDKRGERGRRRIDRAIIYALFPVMLCGFPLFILVVVIPTAMQIMDTFKMTKALFG